MDEYLKDAESYNCMCGADYGETVPDLRCGTKILLSYLEVMM